MPPPPEAMVTTKSFSMDEVAKHRARGDLWVVVDGRVLDLSGWTTQHPGGERTLLALAGTDASDQVRNMHPARVLKGGLERFVIGHVEPQPAPRPALVAYRELRERLRAEGAFDTNMWWYALEVPRLAMIFGASLVCIFLGEHWAIRCILGGLVMGVFFQQVAFVGHDLGHNGVTHNSVARLGWPGWNDHYLGLIAGNVLAGIDIGWWKSTHNVHHIVTNSVEGDPDIQHLPVFAISPKFFNSVWSTYHERVLPFDMIARFIIGYQHYLYWIVMCAARFNLYIQSLIFLLKSPDVRTPVLQWLGLGIFWTWFTMLTLQLPTWPERVAFVLLSHIVAGVLHIQITLSHFSMRSYQGVPTAHNRNASVSATKPLHQGALETNSEGDAAAVEDDDDVALDFLDAQLSTTMDVDCHPALDWVHGGLQFQTIHHLFPRIPRHRLRELSKEVAALCLKHGLTYHRVSFLQANREIFYALRETALEAKRISPLFWDSLNAQG